MIALCSTLSSWSADFVANGIKYSINSNGISVTVIANTEKYSGDIVIPSTVTNEGKNYSVTAIGSNAFNGCSSMTSIPINEGIETIGYEAFKGCTKLKTLTIPNSVTSIGGYLASSCTTLTAVTIGDWVRLIPSGAFSNLNNLETIILGSKVSEIEAGAFTRSISIETIQCKNPTPAVWSKLNETFASEIYSTCTLYVPAGTLEAYKTADGWKNFFNIKEMGDYDEITIDFTGKRTYCSSNDLDFAGIEGLKAYIANGYDRATGTVLLTRVEKVPAGTGLMLAGKEGTYQVPRRSTQFYYVNLLKGVLQEQSLPATENGYTNYVLRDGPDGVVFYVSSGSIEANKAYLQVPSTTSQTRDVLYYTLDDEMVTGVKQSWQEDAQQKDVIYNLNGQRTNQVRKGIYIQNGKKIIIR